MTDQTITSVSRESRIFKPSAEFKSQANLGSYATYRRLHAESVNAPDKFWGKRAKEFLLWRKPFSSVLKWKAPYAKWFSGGHLNVSENCLDRHATGARANKAAIIFEGEPGDVKTITYAQLHREVCKFANQLESLGLKKGDRVAIYLPMVPEAAVAMLACARLGVIHTVIFGGFSSEAIKDRVNDCQAKVIITADGSYRRGKLVELKANVDRAVGATPTVQHVIVLKRAGNEVPMTPGRDRWWHDLMAGASSVHKAKAFESETPLFILYTSGSTGKPKGVLHTSAGYLLGTTMTSYYVFDLKESDVYWCTADIGWITGHSYVVYGPLSCGATVLMYEGAPNHPAPDRFWD
ncbi:MAG: acetate--CoA ligase, partial [Lacunisphaera sp.]|nr:acetate--CoA ligase [Lacunisphaera sp.]